MRIEQHQVGPGPFLKPSAVGDAIDIGGAAGDRGHCAFQGHGLLVARPMSEQMQPKAGVTQKGQMRTGIRQRDRRVLALEQACHLRLVGVEELALPERIEFAVQNHIEQPVKGIDTSLLGPLRHALLREFLARRINRLLQAHMRKRMVGEAVRYTLRARLGLDSRAKRRVGKDLAVGLLTGSLDGWTPCDQRLERIGVGKRELHPERKAAHLTPQFASALACLGDLVELAENPPGVVGVHEHRGDHHRASVVRGYLLEPGNCGGHPLGEHEDAAPCLAERPGERKHLGMVGKPRRHRYAMLAVVLFQRGGGKTHRPCAHRVEHQGPHLRDLVGARRAA